MIEKIAGCTIAFAAMPTVNPTSPSEPRSVTILSQAGQLYFDWEPPVVKPLGTRYRIIAAANCADASVGTAVWNGDVDNAYVPWTDTRTRWFWWLQAYSNSYFSPYTPNTFGTWAIPSLPPNALKWPIPDPQLRQSLNIRSYWWQAGGALHQLQFVSSGGLTADTGRISIVGTTNMDAFTFGPDRRGVPGVIPPFGSFGSFEVGAGQTLSWKTAFRRTTALTGTPSFEVILTAIGDGGIIALVDTFINVATCTVNQWSFAGGDVVVPNSRYTAAELYLSTCAVTSGTIEIGLLDCSVS